MTPYTPMIQQYLTVKAAHKDAFLFFRLGDFYEMFFDDALEASRILEITLTSREGGSTDKIPMCGVPYHSASNYIRQLVENGHKVAICEQVEDPKAAKGVVKREVVQIITPGTVMEHHLLEERDNKYIASIAVSNSFYALAVGDLSTGELKGYYHSGDSIEALKHAFSMGVVEVINHESLHSELVSAQKNMGNMVFSTENNEDVPPYFAHLTASVNEPLLLQAAGRLLHYLEHTQKRSLDHLRPLAIVKEIELMKLDAYSKRNLELTETIRLKGKKGSLLWLLDRTKTSMGARKLKQWIEEPLFVKEAIQERLDFVEALTREFIVREEIREYLKSVYDMERLAGKVAYGNLTPRDLLQLKISLQRVPDIAERLSLFDYSLAKEMLANMNPHDELTALLENAIHEDAPLNMKEGGIIKKGYHPELDKYRDASMNGKTWIASLEQQERQATGIKSLKIGFNKIFGYFIEVTRSNLQQVPGDRYERKQTLANAERYVTPELKEKERLILEAEEKMAELEYKLFGELREHVKQYISSLQLLASSLATLDVLLSFAEVSTERRFVKPVLSTEDRVRIINGRHPVVEMVMDAQEYVANDVFMDKGKAMLLITGPNMAGKSTYMRQLALTSIMMQVGCFVPADEAELPLFDQIFTRIGAADDLVGGQSTFMVEMLETNFALSHATESSLILLDEIGRGTSTYDGMALAQSIIEYIHEKIRCKTLFSTHYHELTVLSESLPLLKNIHVTAMEEKGKLVFLHKVKEGQADKSFGIQVAELAELPSDLIERAKTILTGLEEKPDAPFVLSEMESAAGKDAFESQLTLFEEEKRVTNKSNGKEEELKRAISSFNLLEMTPIDAMNALYELQRKVKR